jgi:hypothetical protein
MWPISSIEPTDSDLDVRRATKAQDTRLDLRTRQQGGRRKQSRLRQPAAEDALEVDTFEHGKETTIQPD